MLHAIGSFVVLLGLFAQAKDNPEYEYWSGCKPGSWVKLKLEGEIEGQKLEITDTAKLVEVTKEKAVLEHVRKMKAGGQELPEQKEKEDVEAKEEKPDKILKESEEEIEVNGKKLKCKVIELEKADDKSKMKLWVSKEIPGGVAKGEITLPPEQKGTLRITAVEWEKK